MDIRQLAVSICRHFDYKMSYEIQGTDIRFTSDEPIAYEIVLPAAARFCLEPRFDASPFFLKVPDSEIRVFIPTNMFSCGEGILRTYWSQLTYTPPSGLMEGEKAYWRSVRRMAYLFDLAHKTIKKSDSDFFTYDILPYFEHVAIYYTPINGRDAVAEFEHMADGQQITINHEGRLHFAKGQIVHVLDFELDNKEIYV